MSVSYSININFDKNEKAPERVFHAMALYIEGFNELQYAFIKGYSADIAITSSLEVMRGETCIADITHTIKDTTLEVEVPELFDGIYRGILREMASVGVVDSAGDIKGFTENVHRIAAETVPEYTLSSNYGGANPLLVADALHKIHKAKRYISDKDSVQLGDPSDAFIALSVDFSCPRNGENIFSYIESKQAKEQVLIVRRPSFVAGGKWEFDNPNTSKSVAAIMSDSEWLVNWHHNNVQITPGDALLVDVEYTVKTNLVKQAIRSVDTEITKVVRIIGKSELATLTLEPALGLDDET